MLFGQEHVERYVETDAEEGHEWQGTTVLILTTKGRKSGEARSTPLIYQRHGDGYLVVASRGGADEPPGWFPRRRRGHRVPRPGRSCHRVHFAAMAAERRAIVTEDVGNFRPLLARAICAGGEIWLEADDGP